MLRIVRVRDNAADEVGAAAADTGDARRDEPAGTRLRRRDRPPVAEEERADARIHRVAVGQVFGRLSGLRIEGSGGFHIIRSIASPPARCVGVGRGREWIFPLNLEHRRIVVPLPLLDECIERDAAEGVGDGGVYLLPRLAHDLIGRGIAAARLASFAPCLRTRSGPSSALTISAILMARGARAR